MTATDPVVVKITMVAIFVFGFAVGYKAKEWRIWWTKRKRDVLANQLQKAQKQLELLTTP